jgi:hypothetical protein
MQIVTIVCAQVVVVVYLESHVKGKNGYVGFSIHLEMMTAKVIANL